jgi:ribonuclease P/MRP protein subunit POP5
MKPLLPSLKEKKRYIVFEVLSNSSSSTSFTEKEINTAIKDSMQKLIGTLGMAKAGLQFIHEKWNKKHMQGIVRVNHTTTNYFTACLPFIRSIKNKKVLIHSLGTSGILIKADKKYMAR